MSIPEGTEQAKTEPLLAIAGLRVEYPHGWRQKPVVALDGVGLEIGVGETLGVVGESGSGKSTLGRALVGLVRPTAGNVSFAGSDITDIGRRDRQRLSSELQIVYQDPYGSLNPTRTVGQTLLEALRVHNREERDKQQAHLRETLERVGLTAEALQKYPRQLSGGQRQRVAIARALVLSPRLVICDEPVSALDLSVQAQVLNLLRRLQAELQLSYLFISHDLAVVRYLAHRVLVLYRGRVMESGPVGDVCVNPGHPYTQALLAAIPIPSSDERSRRTRAPRARPQSNQGPRTPEACVYSGRCPLAIDVCRTTAPPAITTPNGGTVYCHRFSEAALAGTATATGVRSEPSRRNTDHHSKFVDRTVPSTAGLRPHRALPGSQGTNT